MKPAVSCKHLRTKSMYIPALTAEGERELPQESLRTAHCWCNCTLTETGPDDHPVGFEHCGPQRPCFKE